MFARVISSQALHPADLILDSDLAFHEIRATRWIPDEEHGGGSTAVWFTEQDPETPEEWPDPDALFPDWDHVLVFREGTTNQ